MKKIINFLPWLAVIGIFIFQEETLQNPKLIYYFAPASLILLILIIWQLTGREIKIEKFWRFLITPVFFLASGILFLGFLEGVFIKQFFLFGLVTLLWAYLEILFLRFNFRPKYEPYSLENVTVHLNLLTIYLVTCGFYSLILFLSINFWGLFFIYILVNILITSQVIWASGVTLKVGWAYLLVIPLVLAEMFLAVSYLPTSIYVSGLIVTLTYYLISGLGRNWLLEIKNKEVILRYLILSIVIFFIILITAKWF